MSPPLPGAGDRVLAPDAQREYWYQAFHQLSLVEEILDGRRDAVRAYLRHFWSHWSGPSLVPSDADLDRLADLYGEPGAFTASIVWYRAGSGTVARSLAEVPPAPDERIAVPTTVFWPEHDPLFPPPGTTGWPSSSPTARSRRSRASATSSRSKRQRNSPRGFAPRSRAAEARLSRGHMRAKSSTPLRPPPERGLPRWPRVRMGYRDVVALDSCPGVLGNSVLALTSCP